MTEVFSTYHQNVVLFPGNIPHTDQYSQFSEQLKVIIYDQLADKGWMTHEADLVFHKDVFLKEAVLTNKVYLEKRKEPDYLKLLKFIYHDSSLYHIAQRKLSFKSLYDTDIWIEKVTFRSYQILLDHKVDMVVTHDTPHVVFDYIFCRVAKFLGIDVYNIRRSTLPWRTVIERGVEWGIPVKLQPEAISGEEKTHVKDFLNQKIGDYDAAKPLYEKKRESQRKGKFWNWKEEIKDHFIVQRKNWIIATLSLRSKYNTYKDFMRYSRGVEPDGEFIVFFLHLQPERTTLPEGDFYDQQIVALRTLSLMLPDNVKILVKEHPATFRFTFNKKVRSSIFYKTLTSIPNVYLCPLEINSFELIDKSIFVATITGTVGIEAVCREKCCIYFGNAPFKGIPGAYYIDTVWGSDRLLNSLLKGENKPSKSALGSYLIDLTTHTQGKLENEEEYYARPALLRGLSESLFRLFERNQELEA